MKNLLDIIQLLKRYGIFVYTGERKSDIFLMESEIKDLYDGGMLLKEDYLVAMMILRKELSLL